MAQRVEHNPPHEPYAVLLYHGLDVACEALRLLIDEASKIERENFPNAGAYGRNAERTDHANGLKPKTMKTRLGELTFAVP